MTMPLRTAPPPPSASASQPSSRQPSMRHQHASAHRSQSSSPLPNFGEFGQRKAPPPRPPPPKISQPTKSSSSSNVFANLFGKPKSNASSQLFSLPPPPGAKSSHHHPSHFSVEPPKQLPSQEPLVQLISFDSPPSSPTPSTKPIMNTAQQSRNYAALDLLSSDPEPFLFGSSSSSSVSHVEGGFEDAFVSKGFGAWDSSDPFSPLPSTMPMFEASRPSNASPSQTPREFPSDFLDPLCNGKSLLAPQPVITMPTIIKPAKPQPNVRV